MTRALLGVYIRAPDLGNSHVVYWALRTLPKPRAPLLPGPCSSDLEENPKNREVKLDVASTANLTGRVSTAVQHT